MGYYVIGVGGTGAKCVEALTHLCSAGLMPRDELYALFVDPDISNGNVGRAEMTLRQYIDCRQLALGSTDLFKTGITAAGPDIWSPFDEGSSRRLHDIFGYSNLEKPAARLFDVLYSPQERQMALDGGFRGRPSVASAVMARTVDLGNREPWKTFRDKLALDAKRDAVAKIMLIGSVFGATGASGVPAIARLIRKELAIIGRENVRLGAILVLPYFSFNPFYDVRKEKLETNSESFLLNTQAVLDYYHRQRLLEIYDAVYLLGDHNLTPVKHFCQGGKNQYNEPHFIELIAALGAVDFYRKDWPGGLAVIARHEAGKLTWNDLPYLEGFEVLKKKIECLTRFCFAYLSSYNPMLQSISITGQGYRAPWYIDFFKRTGIDLKEAIQKELLQVAQYCTSFLGWIGSVQTSANYLSIDLINYRAFARKGEGELLPPDKFKKVEFGNLVLPRTKDQPNALSRLWERMCNAKVRDKDAYGVGRFVHTLYRECSNDHALKS